MPPLRVIASQSRGYRDPESLCLRTLQEAAEPLHPSGWRARAELTADGTCQPGATLSPIARGDWLRIDIKRRARW